MLCFKIVMTILLSPLIFLGLFSIIAFGILKGMVEGDGNCIWATELKENIIKFYK